MSLKLNDLEKEIVLSLSNRVRARWTDIKADVSEVHKKQYKGTGFDVVFSRSLNRLVDRKIIWKMRIRGSVRPGYWISPKGNVLAWKIKHGLSVEDIYRDEILAFSSVLHRLRNDAVTTCEGDGVLDYFKRFKELILGLDLEMFVEEVKIHDMIIESYEDPLDLLDFSDEDIDYFGEDETG